jgi:hypothetical protein
MHNATQRRRHNACTLPASSYTRPTLARAFLDRPARLLRDDAELDERERAMDATPAILSIRPAAATPSVGRLERDHSRVLAGLRAGHEAVRDRLCSGLTPGE